MSARALCFFGFLAFGAACSAETPTPAADAGVTFPDASEVFADAGAHPDAEAAPEDSGVLTVIPESAQRTGDPAEGYRVLLNEGYVGCGLPRSAYSLAVGPAPAEYRLSGRTGFNETLPYDMNAFTVESGVEVVASNCLTCHASMIGDRVIIGLGDANRDFTFDASRAAELAGAVINDPDERAAWSKWSGRMRAVAPYIRAKTIGANPADNLGLILFAHHDQQTLEWSETPLLEPPPAEVVAIDTPPWWRMKKKNAMFYSAAGRGDHARIMMTASVLCVDSVNQAGFIDTWFPHVRAYISSLEPPPYPEAIDQPLADRGRNVFVQQCARCHGTYGENETYPNLLVSLEEVGTDPTFALGALETSRFSDWFNGSFYGELSQLQPARGYVAPPLDGIWVTAPFLHNGSVPNIEALLDSSKRPTYFARTYVSTDYVPAEMGWRFEVVDHGHAEEPNATRRTQIYDTTLPGMGNGGHTFGDALSTEERREVIEYLKTL